MATAALRTSYTVKKRSRAGEHEGDVEGTTHAATGILAGAGIGLLTHAGAAHGLPAWTGIGHDLLYGAVAGGLALLPDADHPKASFAYAAGPLSRGISHLIAVAFGGHRQGMHSVAGVAVMATAAQACAVWRPNHWSLGVLAGVLAICVAAGLSATGFLRHGWTALAAGCVLAGLAVGSPSVRPQLWWLVVLGMGLHILEDMFTGHGVALAWPLTGRRYGGDRRQPAGKRKPSGRPSASRPRPARPKTVTAPWNPAGGLWTAVSGECLTGRHGDCRDAGCKCEHPGAEHLSRHGSKTIEPAAILPPDEPPPF